MEENVLKVYLGVAVRTSIALACCSMRLELIFFNLAEAALAYIDDATLLVLIDVEI